MVVSSQIIWVTIIFYIHHGLIKCTMLKFLNNMRYHSVFFHIIHIFLTSPCTAIVLFILSNRVHSLLVIMQLVFIYCWSRYFILLCVLLAPRFDQHILQSNHLLSHSYCHMFLWLFCCLYYIISDFYFPPVPNTLVTDWTELQSKFIMLCTLYYLLHCLCRLWWLHMSVFKLTLVCSYYFEQYGSWIKYGGKDKTTILWFVVFLEASGYMY